MISLISEEHSPCYPARTWQRLEEIKIELQQCQSNIQLIKDFHQGTETLRGKQYSYRNECSRKTKDDRARAYRTINNQQIKIQLLELEYTTLVIYGVK